MIVIQVPVVANNSIWKPTTPAEFWALVEGAAGVATVVLTVVLAIIAWKGLRSIALAQKDMMLRATREARACAVARCHDFADQIIPANAKILTSFAQHKIPVFVKDANEVVFDVDKESRNVRAAQAWIRLVPNDLFGHCIALLNRLEGWSMHFTKGLGDADSAFGPCAPAYCSMVMQLYPVLVVTRTKDSAGKYPNIVELFSSWYGAREDAAKRVKRAQLLEQLEKLQAEGPRGATIQPALGTDFEI